MRTFLTFVLVSICSNVTTLGIEVEQLTSGLDRYVYWDYDPNNGGIRILQGHATKTFVFWSHQDGDPNTLAQIEYIERDPGFTSGRVKFSIRSPSYPYAGATDVNLIALDTDQINSIIEGIKITGNFLLPDDQGGAPMVVDEVTGTIEVRYDMLNGMTVNGRLETLKVGTWGGSATGGITVGGNAKWIELGWGAWPGVTNCPITITGDLEYLLKVYGDIDANSHISIGGNVTG